EWGWVSGGGVILPRGGGEYSQLGQEMHDSDEQLIAAVAAGDRDAFAALYRRRRRDVYRFALHMTGAPAAAEDVAQDVFLAVIREAQRYTPGRSGVVPWLLGIARNLALPRITDRGPAARAAAGPGVRTGRRGRSCRGRRAGAGDRHAAGGAGDAARRLPRGGGALRPAGALVSGGGRRRRLRDRHDPIAAASRTR